jgi:Flp pilus assembly protein TadG
MVVSTLAALTLGIVDFGMAFFAKMQIATAAQGAASYAVRNSTADTTTPPAALPTSYRVAIETAAVNGTGLTGISTPDVSHFCACPDAASGMLSATCGSSCAGGGTAGKYIQIEVESTYATIVPWPGISSPITLRSTATARLN